MSTDNVDNANIPAACESGWQNQNKEENLDLNTILVNSAPFVLTVWDDEYKILAASDQVVKIFGLSSKREYLERFFDFSPELQPCGMPSTEKAKILLEKTMTKGQHTFEWMHINQSGEPLPMEIAAVRFTHGKKDMVAAYAIDIRPIKAVVESEKKALDLARRFLDAAPIFIETWDNDMNLTGTNQEAVKMFGLRDTEHYLEVYEQLHPEYQPCGMKTKDKAPLVIEEVMKNGYTEGDWMHIDINGEEVPVRSCYVRFDVGNEEKYIVGYSQDLRPMKKAMEKLKASEERSKILLDASPIPSIIFDDKINAADSNFAALTLFAVEPGKTLSETYPNYPKLGECVHEQCIQFNTCGRETCPLRKYLLKCHQSVFMEPGMEKSIFNELKNLCMEADKCGTIKTEATLYTLYGNPIPCEITVVSVNYNDSQGFAFYLRDMREEKRRRAAEDANRAKSSFLSTVSHEIRTPLNAILGITEIRLMDNEIDTKIREDLMKIYTSSDVLLKIINDILDLSKIEAGKLPILERKYELASLISDTAQINLMHIGSKPIEFSLSVDENLPTHLFGDELRMKQILSNLLSNAFKYTEKGNVTLEIMMHQVPESDGEIMLEVKVTDSGVGMTKQQIDDLFEEFTRFYQSETNTMGTGLGMSITQKLVALMGGKLTVESEHGKGSVFTAFIPQAKFPGAEPLGREMVENLRQFKAAAHYSKSDDIVREPMPYGKVLVVDDVEINIYVVIGLLAPYRLQIDEAADGMEAIEKVKNGSEYDIIFMDHMMPIMDGIEATKVIRGMGYKKPIVALTANAVSGQAEVFLNNGFDDYISKPIDVRSMHVILNRFIRERHLKSQRNEKPAYKPE